MSADVEVKEKSFFSKFKVKAGIVTTILNVLAAVLGIWLAPEQIEVVITMMVGITGIIALIVNGHVKTDIEAVKNKTAEFLAKIQEENKSK